MKKQKGIRRSIISLVLCASILGSSFLTASCSKKSATEENNGASDGQSAAVNDPTWTTGKTVNPGSTVTPGTGTATPTVTIVPGEPLALPTSETTLSDSAKGWQYDITFPDWQDRSSQCANNRLGFYGYSGQGIVYICPDDNAGDYSLYINDIRIDTSSMENGKTYALDISAITRNGTNSLQLSSLSEGKVAVKIPYPTVISGTIQDVGISEGAIQLIDSIISSDIEHGFPSAQIAIVKDGRLVYENAWGNISDYDVDGNYAPSSPVTTDTLYDLASVTKVFSATYAIQYLVSEGKLDIDTKIVDILGNAFAEDTMEIHYANQDYISLPQNKEWKAQLTIRNLLMHQGGFPAGPLYYNDKYDVVTQSPSSSATNILYVGTGADEATREDMLQMLFKTPLMYEPGTKTLYSDLDFMILCFVVEKVTGKRIDDFLKETFWEPMGLTHITYRPLDNGFTKEDCAATELKNNNRKGPLPYTGFRDYTIQGIVHDPNSYYCMAGISGHAGLFSNATDLAILASVMLTGGYGDLRFFSQNTIDLFPSIQDVDSSGYALGWWREGDHARDYYFGSVSDSTCFGHQGFTGTFVYVDPVNNMTVVILTNKLHSLPVKGEDGVVSGSKYTTGWLGFVAEILEIGLNSDYVDEGIWKDLVSDMAADIRRELEKNGITDHEYPKWKAYESLVAVCDSMG